MLVSYIHISEFTRNILLALECFQEPFDFFYTASGSQICYYRWRLTFLFYIIYIDLKHRKSHDEDDVYAIDLRGHHVYVHDLSV